MDVIAGARYWHLDTSFHLNVTVGPISKRFTADATKDWVDPFIGLRSQIDLLENLFFYIRGDVGGFDVGSELTWKAEAGLCYNVTPRASMFLGWKVLDVDYKDGGFEYAIRQSGPLLGFGYTFGGPSQTKSEKSGA